MQRIKAPARRDSFPAYRQSGDRALIDIDLIVWHDTEGGTARSIAAYFQSPSAGGSAHLVVDDVECQRCLADTTIPWGAPGANQNGFHIEQCGYASWTRKRWLMHQPMLHRTAYKTAVHCKKFGIPVRFLDALGVLSGKKGITTHAEISKAYHTPGGHTDPGANFPRKYVMFLTWIYRKSL